MRKPLQIKYFQKLKELIMGYWVFPITWDDRSVLDVYLYAKIFDMGDPLYTIYLLYKRI